MASKEQTVEKSTAGTASCKRLASTDTAHESIIPCCSTTDSGVKKPHWNHHHPSSTMVALQDDVKMSLHKELSQHPHLNVNMIAWFIDQQPDVV